MRASSQPAAMYSTYSASNCHSPINALISNPNALCTTTCLRAAGSHVLRALRQQLQRGAGGGGGALRQTGALPYRLQLLVDSPARDNP